MINVLDDLQIKQIYDDKHKLPKSVYRNPNESQGLFCPYSNFEVRWGNTRVKAVLKAELSTKYR